MHYSRVSRPVSHKLHFLLSFHTHTSSTLRDITPVMMFTALTTTSVFAILMMLLQLTWTLTVDALYLSQKSLVTGAVHDEPYRSSTTELVSRIVYNPHITSPTAGTVWKAGSKVTVTWCVGLHSFYLDGNSHFFLQIRDTSDAPKAVTNNKGTIILGYQSPDSDNEHLDVGKK